MSPFIEYDDDYINEALKGHYSLLAASYSFMLILYFVNFKQA